MLRGEAYATEHGGRVRARDRGAYVTARTEGHDGPLLTADAEGDGPTHDSSSIGEKGAER